MTTSPPRESLFVPTVALLGTMATAASLLKASPGLTAACTTGTIMLCLGASAAEAFVRANPPSTATTNQPHQIFSGPNPPHFG